MLTVMTYNVGNGRASPQRLVRLLRQVGADVIGLQELTVSQSDAIAPELVAEYPYQVLTPGAFFGKGLLSRLPILNHQVLELYPLRPDLLVVIEYEGMPTTVVVAHPPPPRLRRYGFGFDVGALAQLDALAMLSAANPATLLIGDFNMTTRNPLYARFRILGLMDAFGVAGTGPRSTLPTRVGPSSRFNFHIGWFPLPPVIRVDYIWYTAPFVAEAAWVGPDAGSDHLPVIARFSYTSPEQSNGTPVLSSAIEGIRNVQFP